LSGGRKSASEWSPLGQAYPESVHQDVKAAGPPEFLRPASIVRTTTSAWAEGERADECRCQDEEGGVDLAPEQDREHRRRDERRDPAGHRPLGKGETAGKEQADRHRCKGSLHRDDPGPPLKPFPESADNQCQYRPSARKRRGTRSALRELRPSASLLKRSSSCWGRGRPDPFRTGSRAGGGSASGGRRRSGPSVQGKPPYRRPRSAVRVLRIREPERICRSSTYRSPTPSVPHDGRGSYDDQDARYGEMQLIDTEDGDQQKHTSSMRESDFRPSCSVVTRRRPTAAAATPLRAASTRCLSRSI
jgi:hypothetical protein